MTAMSLNRLPHHRLRKTNASRSRTVGGRKPSRVRAKEIHSDLLTEPIPFVNHPVFQRANPERQLARLAPLPDLNPPPHAPEEPGLTFVAGFVSLPLLTAAEEESLFAWMNYYRFRAEQLRRRWLTAKSPRTLATQVRQALARADALRNRIVSSNLRLVVALAKKLSRSLDHMSDLISEGVLPLIRSVELFDISLGNRFSTYATWAVRNQMLRSIKRATSAANACGQAPDLFLESLPAQEGLSPDDPTTDTAARQVQRLIARLPERERLVLRARFGLAGEPAGQSLSDVADRVGLSKERVRQIVLKSLEELRAQFADSMEEL